MADAQVRNAATIIVVRDTAAGPAILMGQRGAKAAFMPGKFVFPGGAVDTNDALAPTTQLPEICATRLSHHSDIAPQMIAAAAIRELWEETGQILGAGGQWDAPPTDWAGFAAAGHIPNAAALTYFFRAVTPTGAPRRFDARFFLARADDLSSNPDDFTDAQDELSHLQWVPLMRARDFDLPFITQVVLAELMAHLPRRDAPDSVPFFANDDELHMVTRLGGSAI